MSQTCSGVINASIQSMAVYHVAPDQLVWLHRPIKVCFIDLIRTTDRAWRTCRAHAADRVSSAPNHRTPRGRYMGCCPAGGGVINWSNYSITSRRLLKLFANLFTLAGGHQVELKRPQSQSRAAIVGINSTQEPQSVGSIVYMLCINVYIK